MALPGVFGACPRTCVIHDLNAENVVCENREASHAMLAYLDPLSPLEFDPPPPTSSISSGGLPSIPVTGVELGSGTGFVAARVAGWLQPGHDLLIATDLPDVCEMLETNLRACPAARVRPLAWGSREHVNNIADELGLSVGSLPRRQLTHVLCSDLVCPRPSIRRSSRVRLCSLC